MADNVRIELRPLDISVTVPCGTPLQEVLFVHGVEFPCGGRGRCRGCRVKVLSGELPLSPIQEERLSRQEQTEGWRLACQCRAEGNLTLDLAQWEAAILSDDTPFSFVPRGGLGIAIDLGTTTLVAQLLDLQTGKVLAIRTGLNAQARHGADIMSRINFGLGEDGRHQLEKCIRGQIGELVVELLQVAKRSPKLLNDIVIVGNTAMHHLFCGLDVEPLSHYPFESTHDGLQSFQPAQLGWNTLVSHSKVYFLPCLGGFVGSDILAGLLATRLMDSDSLQVLIDLGTNGEVAVGNREQVFCASTAAGPAFEGARISMGMRAATGAVSEVTIKDRSVACRVLGNAPPRGICGSGLVDAVAAGLDLGWIQPSGRLAKKAANLELCSPVCLSQQDVRELQLAKGAIAAGIRLLLDQWGAQPKDVAQVYLAGAFGNYINRQSARRIGLFAFSEAQVQPAGNTALLGAKLALFSPDGDHRAYQSVRSRVKHLSLSAHPHFQEFYLEEMQFPSR